jgi:pyridoxal phosphate-dependent aminotransferase EpsN
MRNQYGECARGQQRLTANNNMSANSPFLRDRPALKYFSLPHMGGAEMKYIQEAFDQNCLSTEGPNINYVEAQFGKMVDGHAVALASGTAALHLGLKLLGVKEGDEVVVPTLTFVASCNVILYEKAVPIFIDSDPRTWTIDPNRLSDFLKSSAKTKKLPKAVIVVHLFGQPADMDEIVQICNQYELPVLEDAAEAVGATYKGKAAGSLGDLGVFSFNGNKIITGSSGGILVSREKKWTDRARYWSAQARDPGIDYLHSEVGYNYQLSNVLAGIIRGQMEVLPERIDQRRSIAFRYRDALDEIGLTLMPQAPDRLHTNWLSCFLIDQERFKLSLHELISRLKTFEIDSRPVWKPMHTQELYRRLKCRCIGGEVAEDLNRRGICLPSSTLMSDDDQAFVIDTIIAAHQKAC